MIAPHATPAAAHAALGKFLTEDAPELMTAAINIEYDAPRGAPYSRTYTAKIHVTEAVFLAWLELYGLDAGEAVLGDWTETNDVLSVTSPSGVEIFCLIGKTDGGAA